QRAPPTTSTCATDHLNVRRASPPGERTLTIYVLNLTNVNPGSPFVMDEPRNSGKSLLFFGLTLAAPNF
ncbi:MAG TPA: hypothetical protein PKE31_07205, partial [Pseudomonadota bacterium]|nr:hypothetical protein [Pseudomonadota bacterium]